MTPVGGQPALELREHHVDVVIENGYAVTSIEQVRRIRTGESGDSAL